VQYYGRQDGGFIASVYFIAIMITVMFKLKEDGLGFDNSRSCAFIFTAMRRSIRWIEHKAAGVIAVGFREGQASDSQLRKDAQAVEWIAAKHNDKLRVCNSQSRNRNMAWLFEAQRFA